MKTMFSTLLFLLASVTCMAQGGTAPSQILFQNYDSYQVPYRIPAIVTTKKGHLLAVADRRYCGFDIGFGKIDMVARMSKDNGATWSADKVIQQGSGINGADDCGYGDAAVVADRNSDLILCMSVTGCTPYFKGTRENPNRIARWYSADGGKSWSKAKDVTDAFYTMLPNTRTMFIGSGRIMQSRVVKKGKFYRLYCSVLTRTQMGEKEATNPRPRSCPTAMSFSRRESGMAVSSMYSISTIFVAIRKQAVGESVWQATMCQEALRWEPTPAMARLCWWMLWKQLPSDL